MHHEHASSVSERRRQERGGFWQQVGDEEVESERQEEYDESDSLYEAPMTTQAEAEGGYDLSRRIVCVEVVCCVFL